MLNPSAGQGVTPHNFIGGNRSPFLASPSAAVVSTCLLIAGPMFESMCAHQNVSTQADG